MSREEMLQIAKKKESSWLRYDEAVGRWARIGLGKNGEWTPQKQKHWEVICPVLKRRETLYKVSLYDLEDAE